MERKYKNVLVASGGGAKGSFAVGVVAALLDKGVEFDYMAGVSHGALLVAMLSQKRFPEMIALSSELRDNHIYKGGRLRSISRFIRGKSSIYDTSPLFELIQKHVNPEDFVIPFSVGCVDLRTGEYIRMKYRDGVIFVSHGARVVRVANVKEAKEMVWSYILASTAIPVAFPTVELNDQTLVDGGARSISPLRDVIQYHPEAIFIVNNSRIGLGQWDGKADVKGVLVRTLSVIMDEVLENDINRFLDINTLVKQVKRSGGRPVARDGKRLNYFKNYIFEPKIDLGDTLDFSYEGFVKRYEHGKAVGNETY